MLHARSIPTLALISLSLAGTAGALSKPATPTEAESTPAPGVTAPAPPQLDTRGTADHPLIVAPIAIAKSPEDKYLEAQDRAERYDADQWAVRLGKVTIGVLIVQGLALLAQALLLRATIRQADKTARRQLKAYVFVAHHTLDPIFEGKEVNARILLRNFGQTPAYRLTVAARGALGGQRFNEAQADIGAAMPIGTLGPGGEYHLTVSYPDGLSREQIAALTQGDKVLYVYGTVRYVDAFHEQRQMNFRVQTAGRFGVPLNELISSREGNDSDGPD
jgi:hypothetical protein